MKILKCLTVISSVLLLGLASCASTPAVSRVDANTVVDLDGYWNDTDVRLVCDSLISECIASPRIASFKTANGRDPIVILGKIRNQSDEHIDTTIVSNKMRNAIINSGVMEFVSSADERTDLRAEKADQAENAYETAKSIGNEQAADYMLIGSVKSIVQSAGNQSVRTYFVDVELHDIETNKIIWSGENSEIKKVIKNAKTKL